MSKTLSEYSKIASKKHNISQQEIANIVNSVYTMLKSEIEKDTLNEIRFQYLGVFKVYPGRAKILLNFSRKRYEKGAITKEQLEKYEKMLLKYIKKHEEN